MIALRFVVGLAAAAGVLSVMGSVLRSVVLPRGAPTRISRLAGRTIRALLAVRLRLHPRSDYDTLDRVLALQGPMTMFVQLFFWTGALFVWFAALFWAQGGLGLAGRDFARAFELAGSSMLTLGFDRPSTLVGQLFAFGAAALEFMLLALLITYLPSVYAVFSRREMLVAKLAVRVRQLPSGLDLVRRVWQLGGFDELEAAWVSWEEWFIELGETHTTFPHLVFFRSPHSRNHWVLSSEAVLDAAALSLTACDLPRQPHCEICLEAGVNALVLIADYLGIRYAAAGSDSEIMLEREKFDAACRQMSEDGIPVRDDIDQAWAEFRAARARYEPLIATLGRMTWAPRSDWSSWSRETPAHRPPLRRISPS